MIKAWGYAIMWVKNGKKHIVVVRTHEEMITKSVDLLELPDVLEMTVMQRSEA